MAEENKKVSAFEIEKAASRNLRGKLKEQLAQDTSHFTESAALLKFHGMYEQDNRDTRQARLKEKKEKEFILMVRTKLPGGKLSAEQYLKLDELSGLYGNGTLRITTRQGIQFHGVLKKNVKTIIRKINEAMITTLGACGDIVRNVVCCASPAQSRAAIELQEITRDLCYKLLPKTKAYHEIWLDGEPQNPETEEEPLYGKTYLPRKFKVGFAYPEDNCIDVYTHDIGLVPLVKNDKLEGFNVLIGGGMGMTHNIATTYPLMAKPLGFISKDKLVATVEAIIKVQRDHGNRQDRKRARMKYLVEEKGIEWFHDEVQKWTGFRLDPIKEMAWTETHDHLGWQANGRGSFFYGIFIENGRIKDEDERRLRTGLKKMIEKFKPMVYLTVQQNLILDGLGAEQKQEIENLLEEHGILKETEITNIRRWSMACPALPTCGLAITESERVLPAIIDEFEKEIRRLGLEKDEITLRMTGCPNGCARPYTSEIGLVGSGVGGFYSIFLGGNFEGTRLNQEIFQKVKLENLISTLLPLLKKFKEERQKDERFGDFCFRMGVDQIKKILSG